MCTSRALRSCERSPACALPVPRRYDYDPAPQGIDIEALRCAIATTLTHEQVRTCGGLRANHSPSWEPCECWCARCAHTLRHLIAVAVAAATAPQHEVPHDQPLSAEQRQQVEANKARGEVGEPATLHAPPARPGRPAHSRPTLPPVAPEDVQSALAQAGEPIALVRSKLADMLRGSHFSVNDVSSSSTCQEC